MSEHRDQAHATITPGEHERCPGGERLQLVSIALTDGGTVAHDDGTDRQPDVLCSLRPTEARQLADRLLRLADHADRLSVR